MRASLLARLLSGLQPDRRSVQQDQGYGAPSRSAHEGGFGGGVGRSAFGAQRPGRSRVFRACWLLSTSPITVKRAVGKETLRAEKEGRRAALRAGDGIPQGRVGRPRFGVRRGKGSLPIRRRSLRLLPRARRLGAAQEKGP